MAPEIAGGRSDGSQSSVPMRNRLAAKLVRTLLCSRVVHDDVIGLQAIPTHTGNHHSSLPLGHKRKVDRMDSYFTKESHNRLREQVRALAEAEIRPHVSEMEESRAVQHRLPRFMAIQGWMGATISEEYGGLGIGHLGKTIIIEEVSRVSGAMGAALQASQLGVAKILHFGSDAQKRKWLPAIAVGDCLPTIAVTEPESGGHVLGMTATAERDGNDYILNGRKVLVGNSHIGDLHGVVVRTGEGSKGLSAFLVESDRKGLSLGAHQAAMGLHGFSFGELIFENCRVPAANRLGREGDGLSVAYSSSMLYGRANLAAVALGIHRALVEETAAFTMRQYRYGNPLCELPTIKQKLGEMQSRLMTARLAAYHAAYLLDQGLPCDAELVNAKLINVEYALDSARAAMEIHAGCGLFTSRPIERFLRDAHHIFAPAGTSDIQRLRLAETALGASKGQWSQRLATGRSSAEIPDRSHAKKLPRVNMRSRRPSLPTKGGSKRVLLIDDDETFRYLTREIIGNEQRYEFIEASNGDDGCRLAWEQAADVILLDLNMPKVDGVTVLNELSRDERTRRIPVIILTSMTVNEELQARLPVGTRVISKNVVARDDASLYLHNAMQGATRQ
jgi:acyl-CoA dehydrogenase